ncbi:hypothetical protein TNCV_3807271 [Trichonephila clavipes]|nr:hypothetical protein TNCV_3807271 [Trichonephila clavipes]
MRQATEVALTTEVTLEYSITGSRADGIRQFTQGTPNCNTNSKAIVFGIPKELVLESLRTNHQPIDRSGLTPASRLQRSMDRRARNRSPRLPFPPVRVAAHGKHADQTQKQVLTFLNPKLNFFFF